MKRFLASLLTCLALFPSELSAQDFAEPETSASQRGFDFSLNLVCGFPAYEYKQQVDRLILPGMNLDLRFYPSKQTSNWMCGLLFEALYAGSSKDNWEGMQLQSSSGLFQIALVNRIQANPHRPVRPYAEFGIGLGISSTSSTYDVYDRASFVEWFFLGEEDQVYTFSVKDHTDRTTTYSAALGILIKKGLNLQLKYTYMPDVFYVKPEGIQIRGSEVLYDYLHSDIKIISFTLGYNFNLSAKSFTKALIEN